MDNEKTVNKTETEVSEHRVRVLSPGMMVAKRFIRNKLAIAGILIITSLFAFSFIGGAIMPYGESQVFYTTEQMRKDYAGATYISDYQMLAQEGVDLPSGLLPKTILAITTGELIYQVGDSQLGVAPISERAHVIYEVNKITDMAIATSQECMDAKAAQKNTFVLNGKTYFLYGTGKIQDLYEAKEMALAAQLSYTPYDAATKLNFEFCVNAAVAMQENAATMQVAGVDYKLEQGAGNSMIVSTADGTGYAYVSDMNINAVTGGVVLSPDYKELVTDAIANGKESFEYADANGEKITYFVIDKNGEYFIKRFEETRVVDTYAAPSAEHWCGTDANGMDLLARLMYGGRISLLIGFVVVFIELLIGVIVGGVAGFFGGKIDNLLMRFVDVIYCIPTMPLYLILGSIMDYYKASSTVRIYMLCIVISVVGWVGIARIVRGQILSLREQEFMTAAEATGISISRRIFKHLIPNVIPQLIVFASMGIGDIILTEAALSYLGLGVRYPAASWGNIINAVNDSHVMTNYWFVWIPAGFLILLAVLAFNFIGDGLRDAFDPKMKR